MFRLQFYLPTDELIFLTKKFNCDDDNNNKKEREFADKDCKGRYDFCIVDNVVIHVLLHHIDVILVLLMATNDRMINFDALRTAWSLLNEYQQFCSTARFRRKIEEQLRHADISLTQVPWKSMVRNLLCRTMFSEEQLNEMKTGTAECCTAEEIAASELTINALLENQQDDEENLTETWFQIDDLKKRFQRAIDAIGTNRRVHKEILHRILGYSTSRINL